MLQNASHCSPNLILADVLNNSYMHTIYLEKTEYRILRNTRSRGKFQDLEYITVMSKLVLYVIGKRTLLALE
jgi:hypothetical protein